MLSGEPSTFPITIGTLCQMGFGCVELGPRWYRGPEPSTFPITIGTLCQMGFECGAGAPMVSGEPSTFPITIGTLCQMGFECGPDRTVLRTFTLRFGLAGA